MVNTAATEHAVEQARLHPQLGVGLHFNLTLGKPVSDANAVRSLIDASGCFYSRGQLGQRLLTHRVKHAEVERELAAQYKRINTLGISPTHIDSHQHIHGFPLCFNAIATLCRRDSIPMRVPWLLDMHHPRAALGRRVRQGLLRAMLNHNRRKWTGLVHWNQGFGSIFDLGATPEQLDNSHYRALLESSSAEVFELMVHPARDAGQLAGLTRIGPTSEKEWRYLNSGQLPALISELGFTLGHYGNI